MSSPENICRPGAAATYPASSAAADPLILAPASSAAADLAGYVAAAPGLRIFSGNDANPAASMRAGAAGVISGRSAAYPEVYAALGRNPAEQGRLDRIVALGASIGRLKHALSVRGLGGTTARITVDPPDAALSAAIAAEVAALLSAFLSRL